MLPEYYNNYIDGNTLPGPGQSGRENVGAPAQDLYPDFEWTTRRSSGSEPYFRLFKSAVVQLI